jgi:hypothetical protein
MRVGFRSGEELMVQGADVGPEGATSEIRHRRPVRPTRGPCAHLISRVAAADHSQAAFCQVAEDVRVDRMLSGLLDWDRRFLVGWHALGWGCRGRPRMCR